MSGGTPGRRVVALALAALALCPWPAAADWVKVTDTAQSEVFYDPTTVQRAGTHVTVWMMRDLREARVGEGGSFRSIRDQVELDCSLRRVRRMYVAEHPQPRGLGRPVRTEHGPMSWNDVPPRTVLSRLLDLACFRP